MRVSMKDSQVELVKQKADIVAIVGERVNLKKAGRNMKGLCPFHGEKSPSFFVSPEMQMYKCFGCGVSGDVFSFLQAFEGLTFPEALEQLAKKVGITLKQSYKTSADDRRDKLLEVLHMADEFYHFLLLNHPLGKRGLEYLRNRGVHLQTIKDFRIGYAPDSWEAVFTFLTKKKGFKPEDVEAVGLAIRSDKGNRFYDRFRGRVTFPLKTYAGTVVGFAGRLLNPEAKEAKYINSPETELYHKSELLFGLSLTKPYIRQKDRVVVVEGEMDVIGSYQNGVKEVVAIKGSALTEQQVLLLRRLTRTIILALDADEAGQEAMRRGIDVAEKHGVNLRIVKLAGGKDPDEIARSNPDEWKAMIDAAVSVYQFYIDLAFERFDAKSGTGQKQISQFLAPVLSRIENAVERAFYVKALASKLGVSERVMQEELDKIQFVGTRVEVKKDAKQRFGRREKLERLAITGLLQLEDGLAEKLNDLSDSWFSEDYLKRLLAALREARPKKKESAAVVLLRLSEELQEVARQLYAQEADLLESDIEEVAKMYENVCRELEREDAKVRLVKVSQELSKYEGDAAGKDVLQAEYTRLSGILAGD